MVEWMIWPEKGVSGSQVSNVRIEMDEAGNEKKETAFVNVDGLQNGRDRGGALQEWRFVPIEWTSGDLCIQ